MAEQIGGLRAETAEQIGGLRTEMAEQGATITQTLRAAMAEQIGGLATQMRVLHEDVISRIAQLQEGWAGPSRRRPRKK
jgi:hypothetical protein